MCSRGVLGVYQGCVTGFVRICKGYIRGVSWEVDAA